MHLPILRARCRGTRSFVLLVRPRASLFIHPRLPRLFQPLRPRIRASTPFGPALKWPWREQCVQQRGMRQWVWPLWGQVGRQSAESPLACRVGCGHHTIVATVYEYTYTISLFPLMFLCFFFYAALFGSKRLD